MTKGNPADLKTEAQVAEILWRINIQTLAMQYGDCKRASKQEQEIWKQRIIKTLCRINELAQQFNPQELPRDLRPPTEEYLAQSAARNWCLRLSRELTILFMSA